MTLLGQYTSLKECEIELWRGWNNKKGDAALDSFMLFNISPVFLTETVTKKKRAVMAWLSEIGNIS